MKISTHKDKRITYPRNFITGMLGYTIPDFLNFSIRELIHPHDIDILTNKIKPIISQPGKSFNIQLRLLHKTGNYIWGGVTIASELNQNRVRILILNFKDITEKIEIQIQSKKNFEDLENLSKEQAALFNILPASIVLLDCNGKITKVNDEWKRFGQQNGMPENYSYIGKNYIEISEKVTKTEDTTGSNMAAGLKKILRGEIEFFSMEYACDSLTEKRWFSAEARPLTLGNLPGMVIMHVNITERKRSSLQMELFIKNTEESFIFVDTDLKIVSFNNHFHNLYKKYFGLEICKGKSILDYGLSNRNDQLKKRYKKVLAGNIVNAEIKVKTSKNSHKHYRVKYIPAKDDAKNIVGVFITATDITLQKNAELQKEFYQRDKEALINSTDDLIWSIDSNYKLIAANNAFIKNLKESTGQTVKPGDNLMIKDVFPTDFLKMWKQLYKKALTGSTFKYDLYNPPSAPNKETWSEIRFNPIFKNNDVVGVACYSKDVTEETLNFLSLEKAKKDLNKIMDSSLDIICVVSEEGLVVKISAACLNVWGYTPEELIGQPLLNYVHPDDVEKTVQTARRIMTGINVTHFENRYIHKNGSIIPMSWSTRWDPVEKNRYGVARDITEKKKLENAFEIERQQFFDLFVDVPTSMGLILGPDHIFKIANPPYLELIGKNNIIGKSVREVLPEIVEQGFIDLLDNVYTTGIPFTATEMPINFEDKTTGKLEKKYLNFLYRPHKTNTNEIDGILFFAVDVTEQVLSRKKIEESEKRYRQIVETAQEGIWVTDKNNQTIFVNNKLCEILEYKREEILSKSIFEFMDADGKILVTKLLAIGKQEKDGSGQRHFKFISKTGKEVWTNVSANPLFDEKDNYNGSLAMVTNISASKRAEKNIRNSEERQKLIMRSALDAIIFIDKNGSVIFWNPKAENIFGWSEAEIMGEKLSNFIIPPQYQARHDMGMENYLATGNGPMLNKLLYLSAIKKTGEEFPIELTVLPISQDDDVFFCAFIRDISHQKKSELERAKMIDELIQRNRDLEQFTFITSHNLRAPAANIMGIMDFLQDETISADEQKEFIAGLVTSVNQLDTVIKDINKILQVKRDVNNQKEIIHFSKLVLDIIISQNINLQQVNIITDFSEIDEIYSLKGYLHSIFFNLINNSIKYRKPDLSPIIKIKSKKKHGKITLTFKDNGLGIDLQKQEGKIFGLYNRFHNHVEGKGMGLFMVKTQVEAIGGKISLKSEKNKGTKFKLEFETK